MGNDANREVQEVQEGGEEVKEISAVMASAFTLSFFGALHDGAQLAAFSCLIAASCAFGVLAHYFGRES